MGRGAPARRHLRAGPGDAGAWALAGVDVEAALAAGADDAEAWAEEGVEREIRVSEGAVESLTDAASHGIGIRSFDGGRWGYAYGTDLSDGGLRSLAAAAAGAAAVA